MSPGDELYQAILARTSVRRYNSQPLDSQALAGVQAIISGVQPLVQGNQYHVLAGDVEPGEDMVALLGAYGRILSPPHYLVPYITGENHLVTDLGYCAEQIAVRLALAGIGSCYVGCISNEERVAARFGLPDGVRIGAMLVYGTPSGATLGRLVNRLTRTAAGATSKMAADRLFHADSFDQPAAPPAFLAPLIEAARRAPSAVNAQPWRFLWHREALYLFVTARNRRYGTAQQEYRLYDGGICMANISLAMEALGVAGAWTMLDPGQGGGIPEHPADLEPLARLDLGAPDLVEG